MPVEFKTKYAFLKNMAALIIGGAVTSLAVSLLMNRKLPDFGEFAFVFPFAFIPATLFGFIVYFLIPHKIKLNPATPIIGGALAAFLPGLLIIQNLQFAFTLGLFGLIYATTSWLVWMKLRNEKIRIFKQNDT